MGVGRPLGRLEQYRAIGPDRLVPTRERARQLIDTRDQGIRIAAGRVGDRFDQLPDGSNEPVSVSIEL
jgi:hypothetical protein